jgi:hypothetical protein
MPMPAVDRLSPLHSSGPYSIINHYLSTQERERLGRVNQAALAKMDAVRRLYTTELRINLSHITHDSHSKASFSKELFWKNPISAFFLRRCGLHVDETRAGAQVLSVDPVNESDLSRALSSYSGPLPPLVSTLQKLVIRKAQLTLRNFHYVAINGNLVWKCLVPFLRNTALKEINIDLTLILPILRSRTSLARAWEDLVTAINPRRLESLRLGCIEGIDFEEDPAPFIRALAAKISQCTQLKGLYISEFVHEALIKHYHPGLRAAFDTSYMTICRENGRVYPVSNTIYIETNAIADALMQRCPAGLQVASLHLGKMSMDPEEQVEIDPQIIQQLFATIRFSVKEEISLQADIPLQNIEESPLGAITTQLERNPNSVLRRLKLSLYDENLHKSIDWQHRTAELVKHLLTNVSSPHLISINLSIHNLQDHLLQTHFDLHFWEDRLRAWPNLCGIFFGMGNDHIPLIRQKIADAKAASSAN